jgi:hypothetical protein
MHHLPLGLVAEYLTRLEPLSLESRLDDSQGTLLVLKHNESTIIVLAKVDTELNVQLPATVTFSLHGDVLQGQCRKQTFRLFLLETIYAPKTNRYAVKPTPKKI